MSVRVTSNVAGIKAKIANKWKKTLLPLSSQILQDCNYFVKVDTSMLMASSMTNSRLNEGVLIWRTPYARRQYWEIPTAFPDVNPNASWKWGGKAKETYKGDWELLAQKLFGGAK